MGKNGYGKVIDSKNKTTNSNKTTPSHKHNQKTPEFVQNRSWWKDETSSGSHVCLQLSPALTSSSAGNSQGPLQVFRAQCARSSIFYLFPLFQSARWYILLISKNYNDCHYRKKFTQVAIPLIWSGDVIAVKVPVNVQQVLTWKSLWLDLVVISTWKVLVSMEGTGVQLSNRRQRVLSLTTVDSRLTFFHGPLWAIQI